MALFVVFLLGFFGTALANFSSDWINTKADPLVQRSLQWVLLHKKGEAVRSIENSSDWRRELFDRTIEEWLSDRRIFWSGRGTFGFGVADETAILIAGGYKALIEISLRRGATHNLISDLLIAYGLIGAVIYLTLCVAIIRFLWKLYRRPELSPGARSLALVALMGSAVWLLYALIGGTFYPAEYNWFILILIGAVYSGAGIDEQKRRAVTPRTVQQPWRSEMPSAKGRRRLVHVDRR